MDKGHHNSVNSKSHNVNCDIAIQWVWSKFDPSQNPNPLTDYDQTLHNWLRPRDEHVTYNLCQSVERGRLAKYVKYNTNFFVIFIIGLVYWSEPWLAFDAEWLKQLIGYSERRHFTSNTANICKRWYWAAVHWHLGDVLLRSITFSRYLLFLMWNAAVN